MEILGDLYTMGMSWGEGTAWRGGTYFDEVVSIAVLLGGKVIEVSHVFILEMR